jgi:hypothetical protein
MWDAPGLPTAAGAADVLLQGVNGGGEWGSAGGSAFEVHGAAAEDAGPAAAAAAATAALAEEVPATIVMPANVVAAAAAGTGSSSAAAEQEDPAAAQEQQGAAEVAFDVAATTASAAAVAAAADAATAVDWQQLSNQLSMAGFEPLSLLTAAEAAAAAAGGDAAGNVLLPELAPLYDTLSQVGALVCLLCWQFNDEVMLLVAGLSDWDCQRHGHQ